MIRRRTLALTLFVLFAGAGLALASGGEGHGADPGALLWDFIRRVIDIGLVFGLIYYFVRKPARQGLADRSRTIARDLEEAQALRAEAEAKFAEYDSKLGRASVEIAALAAEIKAEALQERDRILAEANQLAERIRQDAGRTADQEIARAKVELRKEAALAAVALAEEILAKGITKDDQVRLVDDYLQKVGEVQ